MTVQTVGVDEVDVRELGAADAAQVAAMADRCGPDTIYRRFHAPRLDAREVLAADVRRREPLGRCHLGAFADGRLVGLASLVPSVEAWEAAVLVEDAWQGRGVGSALAYRLGRVAHERRVGCLRLSTLEEAAGAVRALIRSAGWRIDRGGLSTGVLDVVAEPA